MTKRSLLASFFIAAMLFASIPAFAAVNTNNDSASQTVNHGGHRGGGHGGGYGGGNGGCGY